MHHTVACRARTKVARKTISTRTATLGSQRLALGFIHFIWPRRFSLFGKIGHRRRAHKIKRHRTEDINGRPAVKGTKGDNPGPRKPIRRPFLKEHFSHHLRSGRSTHSTGTTPSTGEAADCVSQSEWPRVVWRCTWTQAAAICRNIAQGYLALYKEECDAGTPIYHNLNCEFETLDNPYAAYLFDRTFGFSHKEGSRELRYQIPKLKLVAISIYVLLLHRCCMHCGPYSRLLCCKYLWCHSGSCSAIVSP